VFSHERYEKGEIQVMFDELKCEITNTETLKAIHQLQNGTSAGPDLASNECIVTIASFTLQCFF